jgi:hypothetical protein
MVLSVIAGLLCLATACGVAYAKREAIRLPRLEEQTLGDGARSPRLSVVVPARDEADTLSPAMESLLGSTYSNLEVVLVNDRSGDDTGAIMDSLAAGDSRVSVVHVQDLPPGWLGKVNALRLGTEASTGSVLLFTDADVCFEPRALERAVAWVERDQLDHLSLIPHMVSAGVWLEALVGHFGFLFFMGLSPSRVNRGVRGAFAGVGAFNMVRRDAFERTEGWEWLRLEVGDDVGLAYLMHRHGAKARFGYALRDLSLEWYPSITEMIRGLEKNLYLCMAQARPARALLLAAALMVPVTSLALCIWVYGAATLWFAAGVMWMTCECARASGASLLAGALTAWCGPLLAWALLRSAWRCHTSGEVDWRGSTYSLKDLRAGQRVRLADRAPLD